MTELNTGEEQPHKPHNEEYGGPEHGVEVYPCVGVSGGGGMGRVTGGQVVGALDEVPCRQAGAGGAQLDHTTVGGVHAVLTETLQQANTQSVGGATQRTMFKGNNIIGVWLAKFEIPVLDLQEQTA